MLLGKEEFFSAERGMTSPIAAAVRGIYVVCVCVCGYKVLEMWAIRMEGVVE